MLRAWLYFKIFCFIAYPVWEWWLGHTKKIKANSTIELVINAVLNILRALGYTKR